MTVENIREELKQVKYYYSRKESFDQMTKIFGASKIAVVAEKYNNIVKDFTPELLDMYYHLYVLNYTQEAFAIEIGVSTEYVSRMNKKVLEQILEVLEGGTR